jgi:hypothetical protein
MFAAAKPAPFTVGAKKSVHRGLPLPRNWMQSSGRISAICSNIFTERLGRTVKYEEVYLHDYTAPRQARTGLTGYFDFYNYRRVHQAL